MSKHKKRGRFVVLDGVDGCGKSTQARLLVEWLSEQGREVAHFRDPGGTELGEELRRVLLDPASKNMAPWTEMLLYMASRAQLVAEKIRPTLESGVDVVCERYLLSTIIYQGLAADIDVEPILAMGTAATEGLVPDLTMILDLDLAESTRRLPAIKDRIERRSPAYHRKVVAGFESAEELVPWRVIHVPAHQGVDDVFDAVCSAMSHVL